MKVDWFTMNIWEQEKKGKKSKQQLFHLQTVFYFPSPFLLPLSLSFSPFPFSGMNQQQAWRKNKILLNNRVLCLFMQSPDRTFWQFQSPQKMGTNVFELNKIRRSTDF